MKLAQLSLGTIVSLQQRFRSALAEDRGLATTEVVVLTAVLIAVAVAGGAILLGFLGNASQVLEDTPVIPSSVP